MARVKLIVGLGNPGKEYEYTRHNVGYLVVQRLAQQHRLPFRKNTAMKALVAGGNIESQECLCALPLTFMNHSGDAVKRLVEKENIPMEDLLVICDDFNLGFGVLRLRARGSSGGHNGLASISESLEPAFPRLRIGVGSPKAKDDAAEYVLGEFSTVEKRQLPEIIASAVECCTAWLTGPMENVMSQFNKRTAHG